MDTTSTNELVDAGGRAKLSLVGKSSRNGRGKTKRQLGASSASGIEPKRTRWLWDSRLPLGELALLGGREGIGKSTVCYQLVADITRGMLPGEYKGEPKNVIVCAYEDAWEYTIVPRLMAAGADLDRVFKVTVTEDESDFDIGLALPDDIEGLRGLMNELSPALLLLDPIISRLSSGLDSHKDADVRKALEPIAMLAHEFFVSVMGIIHVNKSGSPDALNAIMASKAFTSVSRAVLFCMIDPEDDTEERRLLGQAKSNLGPMDIPTLAFKIINWCIGDFGDGNIYVGRVEWLDQISRRVNEMIEIGKQGLDDKTAVAEASEWLEAALLELGPFTASSKVKELGKKAGHKQITISRAAKRLGLVVRHDNFPRRTYWSLPSQVDDQKLDSELNRDDGE